jgi:hypothetical protein
MAGASRPERPCMKHKLELFIAVIFGLFVIFSVYASPKENPIQQKKILITKESEVVDYQTGQYAIMLEYFVDGMPAHYIVNKSEIQNIPIFVDYLKSLGSVVNLLPESTKQARTQHDTQHDFGRQ